MKRSVILNQNKKKIWPKIRKKDNVIVINGSDKGKIGQVEKVLLKKWRVLIPSIGMVKKHKKKTQNGPGVIIEIPTSVHLSNVMYYCSKCKKGSRISIFREKNKKIRSCKRCNTKIDKL